MPKSQEARRRKQRSTPKQHTMKSARANQKSIRHEKEALPKYNSLPPDPQGAHHTDSLRGSSPKDSYPKICSFRFECNRCTKQSVQAQQEVLRQVRQSLCPSESYAPLSKIKKRALFTQSVHTPKSPYRQFSIHQWQHW